MGVTGDIGGHVTPALSIAFEFGVPARFTAVQEIRDRFGRSVRIENRHRDIVLSGLLHVRTPHAGRAQFALVGGAGLVREDTLQREAERLLFSVTGSDFGPYGAEIQLTRWTFGIVAGGDVAIDVNRRVSIVPQIRVPFVFRDALNGSQGLSSAAIRAAVSVRARF
jgi:hypothetical protein